MSLAAGRGGGHAPAGLKGEEALNEESAHAGVRFPPPLIYVGVLVAGLLIDSFTDLLPARIRSIGLASDLRWPLGALIAAIGLTLMAVAAGLFRRAGTNLPPWQPSTALVTDGPFRWTRNPMYLGMTLTYAGIAIAFDSLVALILLAILVLPVMQTQIIAREERYLERKFGDAYRVYKARVRRWL